LRLAVATAQVSPLRRGVRAGMMAKPDYELQEGDSGPVLRLTGDWTTIAVGRTAQRLERDLKDRPPRSIDLSELGEFDTAGALAIVRAGARSLAINDWADRPEAGRIYAMVAKVERESADPPAQTSAWVRAFARVGRGVEDIATEATLSMTFLGRLIISVFRSFLHPSRLRWPAWFSQAERAGLDAIPIITMTNFFIGAVIAFLGTSLLTQFGAGVFTVELVAVAVLREFAVVITSVLLAGRSSSSFAAEIGSMRMNQEVDAMQVMGVDPFQALVIPRLAAMVLMLPLLTFIGIVTGLLGGMLVTWNELGYGPAFFLQRMSNDPTMSRHLLVGMVKAPVFAIVIAAIGCRQGLSVGGDVESLGRRVTAAVVQSIFAIIFLDAIFALIFLELGL
jgi:conserved hypothetical integral membrane protein